MSSERKYSKSQARILIHKYCAYQERSHNQVRSKLFEYGLYPDWVEELIVELIQGNFVNEERFARAFVRGKFRIKKWGRNKIKQALYPHKLSAYVLKKAFSEIDEQEYQRVLEEVIAKKASTVKLKNQFDRNGKIAQYAISRGFESDMVWELVKAL